MSNPLSNPLSNIYRRQYFSNFMKIYDRKQNIFIFATKR